MSGRVTGAGDENSGGWDKERCAWKRGSLFDIAFERAMGLKTHVPLVKKGNVSLRMFDEKGGLM